VGDFLIKLIKKAFQSHFSLKSTMHRPLSFQSSRLAAPIELQGRSVCKSPTKHGETEGKWDNLLLKTVKSERVLSPSAVVKRWHDYSNAGRTIRPELNSDQNKHTTRKIAEKGAGEDPGNMLSFFKKTGTYENTYPSKKKSFKDTHKSDQIISQRDEKRMVRPHDRKQDDLCSHISTLNSPTFKSKEPVEESWSPASPKRNNWTGEKKQDFLRSAISVLPGGGQQTLRSFKDVDEVKIMQSAQSPRMARHMASTFNDEPLFAAPNKKNNNKQSDSTYEDSNRLHPYSKGKKVAYPQHTERNTSTVVNQVHQRAASPTFETKYGGMEPLDLRFPGRRMQSPQPYKNTIVEPAVGKSPAIGQTVYSYRTFASQIF